MVDCRIFVEKKNPFGFLGEGWWDGCPLRWKRNLQVFTNWNLPDFIPWAVSPSAPRQTSSNSNSLTNLAGKKFVWPQGFGGACWYIFFGQTLGFQAVNTESSLCFTVCHNYLPWIFSKQKSEKNLLKLHRCAKPGRVLPVPVPSQKTEARKILCSTAVQSFHLAQRSRDVSRRHNSRRVCRDATSPLPLGPATTL